MDDLARIHHCKIHPCIGIARLGNCPDQYFMGPEAPGRPPSPDTGGFKDVNGLIKRQAARFRVFGYDKDDNVIAELSRANAQISWRVHLANRKAAWYEFQNAMDLGPLSRTCGRRNASIAGAARAGLVIDGGVRVISNEPNLSGDAYQFAGSFMALPAEVYLGELRTDPDGQLLVLGGRGRSGSVDCRPATTFANNDGWYDDTADGPVRATVQLPGRTPLEADPAMAVVTPPNFAPGLYGVVTMYDVLVDLVRREWPDWAKRHLPDPTQVEFYRDIFPILERLVALQAVNYGIFLAVGYGSPGNFTESGFLSQLANPASDANMRTGVLRLFRSPDAPPEKPPNEAITIPVLEPPLYGDAYNETLSEAMIDPRVGLYVTRTQWAALQLWSQGRFATGQPAGPAPDYAHLPRKSRPTALDRANLEEVLGGPFHPGIEISWPLRLKTMWKDAFRLNILPENAPVSDDYGTELRPEAALADDGPFSASGPGTLTRVLGVPWQTDAASCDAGYQAGTFLPLPSFWAARVPNHVLDHRSYGQAQDPTLPAAQRVKHFAYRQPWARFFAPMYQVRINAMVTDWYKLGIVKAMPVTPVAAARGAQPGSFAPFWPDTVWVEQEVYGKFNGRGTDGTYDVLLMGAQKRGPFTPMVPLQPNDRIELDRGVR